MTTTPRIPDDHLAAARVLWNYHDMHHQLQPADVGIGLGSHDLGVATYAAELYQQQLFPKILFTGANAPTTIDRFPRGEAVHYTEHASALGVPAADIITEPKATNTGENITFARAALAEQQLFPTTVVPLICPAKYRPWIWRVSKLLLSERGSK